MPNPTQFDTYLASPYTHPDQGVRSNRFWEACRATGFLLSQGVLAYSPIAHSHPIAIAWELPSDFKFWRRLNYAGIGACKTLTILTIPGWKESVGVTAEIKKAKEWDKEI